MSNSAMLLINSWILTDSKMKIEKEHRAENLHLKGFYVVGTSMLVLPAAVFKKSEALNVFRLILFEIIQVKIALALALADCGKFLPDPKGPLNKQE